MWPREGWSYMMEMIFQESRDRVILVNKGMMEGKRVPINLPNNSQSRRKQDGKSV